jgi:hypothetical protein
MGVGEVHRPGQLLGGKFPAKERIPKLSPARYTASAPYKTAIRKRSMSPAGARSSGFILSPMAAYSSAWAAASAAAATFRLCWASVSLNTCLSPMRT